ncbi:hypothetical protein GDO81_009972 [Engystomops pustulosus]|uniref:Uncharacterized protein n=1 Tax=Engystomops pustulosus TaxID=76066 RepID=A0AAV7BVQ5_ENGPU|nr:hypothetical protein GDO81_009972 [Engystomops pustulosus]KAG8576786.1 hypothetical protein GDO81_009972 [Engystomops pustulosus]
MDYSIKRQFLEDRATVIDVIPVTWNVKTPGPYYCVTLTMSRIKDLVFDFEFESPYSRGDYPVTDFPEKILKLDLSLNELTTLKAKGFYHLRSLLDLNASCNILHSLPGLAMLSNLQVLDLSYNAISEIEQFKVCTQLVHLNLSHNKIQSIKELPSLVNLTQLHLNSNKGNPLAQSNRYIISLKEHTCIRILDNSILKYPPKAEQLPGYQSILRESLSNMYKEGYTRERMKDAVKKTLLERLKKKKDTLESSIHHFHREIMYLQEELTEFEETMKAEMENCIRYIDVIPQEEFLNIDPDKLQKATEQNLFTRFWENGKRKHENVSFKHLTKPEEVVKAAASLLSQLTLEMPSDDS